MLGTPDTNFSPLADTTLLDSPLARIDDGLI